ncbi:MAG: glycosyltransferase [Fervidicoccaceae archaeon]
MDLLLALAIALALVHFGFPLSYYLYLKRKWLNKPWDIRRDPTYKPRVSIIIPTYNEALLIESKLDDIARQDYPKELMEVIVVDSASTDGTPGIVENWAKRNPDLKLVLLREPVRRGMVQALNFALKYVSNDTEVIVFTDTDSFWEKNTLKAITGYFSDFSVGALTTFIEPFEADKVGSEATYRSFYNMVRLGESKIHSTPVHNGALIAYRKALIDRIGGLPAYTGNNDSTPASLIAFMGFRAIQVDDVVVREPILKNRLRRKIRRAQHLILHFIHTKRYAKKLGIYKKSIFNRIWLIESYLHVVNPWMLLVSMIFLFTETLKLQHIAATLLLAGAILLLFKPYKIWIETQLQLILATIKNLWTKEIIWKK